MLRFLKTAAFIGMASSLITSLLFASGGTPGGNGKVPYISFDSINVGQTVSITVHDVDPGLNHYYFAFSTESLPGGGIPLPMYGSGAMFVPNIFIGTGGMFECSSNPIQFYIPPEVKGITIYCQAFIPDLWAQGGLAFSDALEVTFGEKVIDLDNLTLEDQGFYHTLGYVQDYAIDNGTLFLLSGDFGVVWLDCSNPNEPVVGGYQGEFAPVLHLTRMDIQNNKGIVISDQKLYTFTVSGNKQIVYNGSCSSSKTLSKDCVLAGNYAYVGSLVSDIYIFDVSDLSNPYLIKTMQTPSAVQQIQLHDNQLFVLSGKSICIYDLSNPLYPVLSHTIEGNFIANKFSLLENNVFILDTTYQKVHCFQKGIGSQYIEIYTDSVPVCRSIQVLNDHLYVFSYGSGFNVYDISNAGNGYIKKLSHIAAAYNSQAILIPFLNRLFAFLPTLLKFLVIDDLALKTVPYDDLNQYYDTVALCLSGNMAIVSRNNDGLAVYDVSNPSDIRLKSEFNSVSTSRDVVAYGSYIYSAAVQGGLDLLYLSSQGILSFVKNVKTNGYPIDLAREGSILYVGDYGYGITVFNIQNPSNPSMLGSIPGTGYATIHDVTAREGLVYVLSAEGLYIIDAKNPYNLSLKGSLYMPGSHYNIGLYENTAFTCNGKSGISAIDVTNPSTPFKIKDVILSGDISGVAFYKNAAFFSDISYHTKSGNEKVLSGVDAANINNLGAEIKYKYVYGSNWDLKIIGNTMYLLDDACVLRIIKLVE